MAMEKKRILFAEDYVDFHKFMRRACERMGHECIIFSDAADAWKYLQGESVPYDLIVSDNDMPKMQGSKLLELVRGHAVHGKTKFTLFTGSDDLALIELCKKYNALFESKAKMRSWVEVINEGLAA